MRHDDDSLRPLAALGAVAVAFAPTAATAQQQSGQNAFPPYRMGPYMMDWNGWGYGMFLGPLFMILVVVAIVAAIVFVLRPLSGAPSRGQPASPPSANRALDILKERYARGEIDKNEFEERRRSLDD